MDPISFQQPGPISSPANFTPITIQPADPTKAPFQIYLSGSQFTNTWDVTMAFGYNCDLSYAAEPAIYWRLEQDYEIRTGTHVFEYYVEYYSVDRSKHLRPIYMNVNRSTDSGTLLFSVPGPNGVISVTDYTGEFTYLQVFPAAGGMVLGNGVKLSSYDASDVPRNLVSMSGDSVVVGDPSAPGALALRGGAGGISLNGVAKPTVTGSKADGTALASLLSALASMGLITDSTT